MAFGEEGGISFLPSFSFFSFEDIIILSTGILFFFPFSRKISWKLFFPFPFFCDLDCTMRVN